LGQRRREPLALASGVQAGPLTRRLQAEAESAADLQRVVAARPDLPAHVRAAVLALVGTAPRP
jgi:hypothetical protein